MVSRYIYAVGVPSGDSSDSGGGKGMCTKLKIRMVGKSWKGERSFLFLF